jgi:hypothetical protein
VLQPARETNKAKFSAVQLRFLLVDIVAAVRVGDVFRLRHEPGEPFLGLFLRGIGDVESSRNGVRNMNLCQRCYNRCLGRGREVHAR